MTKRILPLRYRAPSVKSLMRIEYMTPEKAKMVRDLIHGKLNSCKHIDDTYSYYVERVMQAVNYVIDAHGVESIYDKRYTDPRLSYINMGDTYDATLLYDYETDTFRVGSWGYYAERMGDNLA